MKQFTNLKLCAAPRKPPWIMLFICLLQSGRIPPKTQITDWIHSQKHIWLDRGFSDWCTQRENRAKTVRAIADPGRAVGTMDSEQWSDPKWFGGVSLKGFPDVFTTGANEIKDVQKNTNKMVWIPIWICMSFLLLRFGGPPTGGGGKIGIKKPPGKRLRWKTLSFFLKYLEKYKFFISRITEKKNIPKKKPDFLASYEGQKQRFVWTKKNLRCYVFDRKVFLQW